ncbi:putative reverse transcriptase domain-containing protein [Tanacetum coccineum]
MLPMFSLVWIMPPRVMTRSAGRPAAASRGGGTSGPASKGGGRTRGVICDQGGVEIDGQGGQVGGQGSEVTKVEVKGMVGIKMAMPPMTHFRGYIRTLGQVVAVGMSWDNFKIRGMVVAMEPSTIQKAMQIAGTLTDEALRNGSIKKNPEKKGNMGEPSKDKNGRDDNKRNKTGNAFATTTNPIRRENTGTVPKCATYNTHLSPEIPCRTCFNYNRLGHFAKDYRVVPRNVNPINARNLTARACYECGSTDHVKAACPRHRPNDLGFSYEIEIASGQLVEIDKSFMSIHKGMDWLSNHKAEITCHEKVVRIPLLDDIVLRVIGERPDEKVRHLVSAKAKEQKQEELVVLVPGEILVASPYRLAPSEMEELSGQLEELQDKGSTPEYVKKETDTRVTCTADALKHSETLCAITMRYMLRIERTILGNSPTANIRGKGDVIHICKSVKVNQRVVRAGDSA